MGRKKRAEEHENMDRWLVSYADFITLLFAFFTTMYAISTVDAQKMGRMVLSMQAAFDASIFPATAPAPSPNSGVLPYPQGAIASQVMKSRSLTDQEKRVAAVRSQSLERAKQGNMASIRKDLDTILMDESLKDRVKITVKKRGVVVSLADAGFFDSGSDTVRPDSYATLDKLGDYFKKLPNFLRVEGHTDNVPIRTARFPSNWELSTARATSIVAFLIQRRGVDPLRLSAAGYGEYHPAETNDTPQGRARNRRTEIIVMTPSAMLQEPGFDDYSVDAPPPPQPGR